MERIKGITVGLLQIILMCLLLISSPVSVRSETKDSRFFLMGDGRIHIKNLHTGRVAWVSLLAPDGSLNEDGFTQIDEVFGFPTKEKGEHISPRLIFMLDYFSDRAAPGKMIQMTSGYRSPEYNSALRDSGGNVAKTSQHMDGMALDFHIEGVSGKKLWELVKDEDCCGVGNYGGADIHLDSAKPRFWEAATSKVRTHESEFNRRIYLSTDYDRYRGGDTIRLSLSAVSDFGFGIDRSVAFVEAPGGGNTAATARINGGNSDFVMIDDRRASRFIYVTVPPNLPHGKYRVKIGFGRKPFEQMPAETLSNVIEIAGATR